MQNMLTFNEDAYNASLLFGIVQPDIEKSVPIKLKQKQDHCPMNPICRINLYSDVLSRIVRSLSSTNSYESEDLYTKDTN